MTTKSSTSINTGSVRFLVLKNAAGRCAQCGVTGAALHVASSPQTHANGPGQLRALCDKCDDSERTRIYDDTCRFCYKRQEWSVAEHGTVWALKDGYPVTEGHHLVIPKRHTADLFTMTETERRDADSLIRRVRDQLLAEDNSIDGFNVGMNCGIEAGQSVLHAHWHIIPRRKGDSRSKKGGVRGVIPERMAYRHEQTSRAKRGEQ